MIGYEIRWISLVMIGHGERGWLCPQKEYVATEKCGQHRIIIVECGTLLGEPPMIVCIVLYLDRHLFNTQIIIHVQKLHFK